MMAFLRIKKCPSQNHATLMPKNRPPTKRPMGRPRLARAVHRDSARITIRLNPEFKAALFRVASLRGTRVQDLVHRAFKKMGRQLGIENRRSPKRCRSRRTANGL